jgi:hypothetical protein
MRKIKEIKKAREKSRQQNRKERGRMEREAKIESGNEEEHKRKEISTR